MNNMKLKIKESNLFNLIDKVKTNKKNQDLYLLLSTYEKLEDIEISLDVFCNNLKRMNMIECFVEKTPQQFKHGIVVLPLEKHLVSITELENFVNIDSTLLPIIKVVNSLDYDNRLELDWFVNEVFDRRPALEESVVGESIAEDILRDDSMGLGLSIVHYEKGVRARPSSIDFCTNSVMAFHNKQFDKTIEFLKIAAILDPKNFFAFYQLGVIYSFSHDFKMSENYLKKSLSINPKFSEARKALGNCYFNIGEFENALMEFEQCDSTNLGNIEKADVEICFGKTKTMLGQFDSAIFHYQKAESYIPPAEPINNFLWALYLWWLQTLFLKRDFDEMIKILKTLVNKAPEDLTSWNNLGFCYNQLGKYDDALNAYHKAHDLNNKEPNALMNLASSYEYRREYGKALDYFTKAKENAHEKLPDAIPLIDKHITLNQKMVNAGIGIQEKTSIDTQLTEFIEQSIKKQMSTNLQKASHGLEKSKPISELRKVMDELRTILQNYIRKKFNADHKVFESRFPVNYSKADGLFKNSLNSGLKRKLALDVFSYVDFGDFPYIISKMNEETPKDIISSLHQIKACRNIMAHFDGPEKGDLDVIDSNLCYFGCMKLIRYFKDLDLS